LTKFTLPLSLETFGNIGYNYGFNLLISPFLSLSQIGILNIYTQFGSIVSMTSGALNNGYLPRFFRQIESNFRVTVKKYFIYILTNAVIITFCVFFLGIFYKYLADSVNEEYSILLLVVYLMGILCYSFKSIGSSYLIIQSKTIKIAVITIVSSVLNIGLGMISTYVWGFAGCIVSLSIGYGLQMLFFNFDTLKRYLIERQKEE
jgi:O-antigen/teichoic acid export membrane protein